MPAVVAVDAMKTPPRLCSAGFTKAIFGREPANSVCECLHTESLETPSIARQGLGGEVHGGARPLDRNFNRNELAGFCIRANLLCL